MSVDSRLKLGIALLVLGLIMPTGVVLVVGTDWPAGVQAAVSGTLVFGPEIMTAAAVAVMGKENFDRIVERVKRGLKMLKPAGNVSRRRHIIGLVLLVSPMLFAWIAAYVPSLMPEEYTYRIAANLGLDVVVFASLFVLGGDFWDKLRALFVHDARALFPSSTSALNARARRA
jgi:hypothetical protein